MTRLEQLDIQLRKAQEELKMAVMRKMSFPCAETFELYKQALDDKDAASRAYYLELLK